MNFRLATIEDIPEIVKVNVDTWRTTYQSILSSTTSGPKIVGIGATLLTVTVKESVPTPPSLSVTSKQDLDLLKMMLLLITSRKIRASRLRLH